MKYKHRMPVMMCRHDNKISYLGGYDYSPILDSKEDYIGKTFNICVVKDKNKGKIKIKIEPDNDGGKVKVTIDNYVKIGEFTITDIKYVSDIILMVEGVIDSEYKISEGELERYVLRLGGLVKSAGKKEELFEILFFYIADVVRDYKKFMLVGTNSSVDDVDSYEFVDIETLEKIKKE